MPNGKSLLLMGFPEYQFGIGNAIRDTFNILRQAGKSPLLRPLPLPADRDLIPSSERQDLQSHFTDSDIAGTTWCFLDPRHIELARAAMPRYFDNRRVMATLWWEYETGSEVHFQSIIPGLHRVICHSHFIKGVIGKYADPDRLYHLPYPFPGVVSTAPRHLLRKRWRFRPEQQVILFSFDYSSSLERKNPFALVRVFSRLSGSFPDARLVLKTSHGNHFPAERARLVKAIRESGSAHAIQLLDVNLKPPDWADLQACADFYVSLHRGEGLGLGMLESMWLGVPVIATAHGGNMDFMDPETAVLVPWEIRPISDSYLPYRHVTQAALPDEDHAYRSLSSLLADPQAARELGERGRNHVQRIFHPTRLYQAYRAFLDS